MNDIGFDIISREIIMTGSGDNGDFELTNNPSVQNGGILLSSRVAILTNPMYGCGLPEQVMGGHPSEAIFELNRWKAMVTQDGATLAKYNASVNAKGQLSLNSIDVSYL